MLILADKLDSLKTRYQNAVIANHRTLRYPLRMQIVTVEGVIKMYNIYAMEKQHEAEEIRHQLYDAEPDYSSDDDDNLMEQ